MSPGAELRRIARFQRERALRLWRMKRPFVEQDAAIRQQLADSRDDAVAMSSRLVDYFWQAQRHYLHRDGTLADYPGWPSIYGATNDAVEGVTRLMPLWAAYASSPLADAVSADAMWSALRKTLLHGTDPAHPGYWGDIDDRSTLICEAADVALAVWLGRDHLWPAFTDQERRRVLHWLRQAVGKRTADNNWHLFVVLIDAVLAALDPEHRFSSEDRLQRVRQFARADGCFTDGPTGQVDLYNAWGFHYLLFWLGEIDATRVDAPLAPMLAEFCAWYRWLFTERGLPLFGRSLCYRFAACAPLLACALKAPETVPPGVALSAYLSNWQVFVREGALRAGRPTQGVFGEDIRWLDPYSGPASSLWGTRSIVLFYYASRRIDWGQIQPEMLPAERGTRSIRVEGLGATIEAQPDPGRTFVEFDPPPGPSLSAVDTLSTGRNLLREVFTGVASRPANNLLKMGQTRFSSALDAYR